MTEREKIDLKREGYAARLREFYNDPEDINARAARKFPYPKVTRHRTVEIRTLYAGVRRYRVEGGVLQCQVGRANAPWEESDWSAVEILALADIIHKPTEEVDA